jgi:hypothetical protein
MIQLYASNFPVPVIFINVLTSRLNMIREAWPTGCPTYPHCQFSCNAHLKLPGQLSQLHIDEGFPVKGFFKPIKLQAVDLLVSVLNQWMELPRFTKLKQDIRLCSSSSS